LSLAIPLVLRTLHISNDLSEGEIMVKKVVLYARVSTDRQTCENQLLELRNTALKCGYEIVSEFVDEGISGSKGRTQRPALDSMLKLATKRKFDMVMVWSIDRLGRSLQNLVEILSDLQSMKIDLYFLQQSMDTSTPSGRMMFSVFGALSEYERCLIRERVCAGLQLAKNKGVKLGRPSTLTEELVQTVKLLKQNGLSVRQICKNVRCGVGTYYAAINQ
jgi:DNA invertase Pin-like site-specific DNA recombinase